METIAVLDPTGDSPLGENGSADLTESVTNSAASYVLLSGPNRSGKSFLLRLLAELWTEIGLKSTFQNLRNIIVPDKLWAKLPVHYQAKIRGGEALFQKKILRDFSKWLHGKKFWELFKLLSELLPIFQAIAPTKKESDS